MVCSVLFQGPTRSGEKFTLATVYHTMSYAFSRILTGFPIEWLELIRDRGNELATEFLSGLPQEVQARTDLADRVRSYLTSMDSKSIGWRIGAAFDAAAEERALLVEKREEATREVAEGSARAGGHLKIDTSNTPNWSPCTLAMLMIQP